MLTKGRRKLAAVTLEALALTAVFGLLAIYTFRSMYGIDVFWHIKAGEWIVHHLAIPDRDTFSAVHPDRPWTTFQWLYEVLVYGLDSLGGLPLLRITNAAVLLLGFALVYRAVRRELGTIGGLFVLALTIVLFEDRFRVRPHVFNFLFLAILLPVLFGGWRRLRRRGVIGVGVVAWLWANVHAGGALLVPVALGGIGAGAVARMLAAGRGHAEEGSQKTGWRGWWAEWDPERRDELARAAVLFAVAVGPMLLMPGFLAGVWTAISMYGASVSLIPEWKEATAYFDLLDQPGGPHYIVCGFAPYVGMMVLGLYVIVRILRKQLAELPWPELLLSALMLFLARRSVRFVYLTALPAVFLLREVRGWAAAAARELPRRALPVVLALLALGTATVSYHYNIVVQRGSLAKAVSRLGQNLEPSRFPVQAAQFLHDAEVEGGVLHLSKWGGYLLWKLWPRCSVFSDGRGNFDIAQVGTMVATHRPYSRAGMLEAAWQIYGFDIVIFPGPVFHLRRWDHERWVRIYAGVEHNGQIEVFVRNNPKNQENIRRVRAWYAAHSTDPRFRGADLSAFEKAAARYGGERWLDRPKRRERLAKYSATAGGDGPPEERGKALFRRAMLYFTAYDVERAHTDLTAAQRLRPMDARILYYLAWTLYLQGHERAAAGALMDVPRLDANGPVRLHAVERMRRDLLLRDLMRRLRPAGP